MSGSRDYTIRVWNPTTGQCVVGPLQGHTSVVNSVVYSPDGSHIVSGSWDKTIRVWDPITAQCIAGPFLGHTGGVISVAYSPDGSHIVSGSDDKTIRVWNPTTGQCIAGPFQGHTNPIKSVAYSSDGSQIVSGSSDKTIRVWNAPSGQCIAGTFQGHRANDLSMKVLTLPGLASFGEMYQQEDGWIELSNGACFCWIPSWARTAFYLPVHSLVISRHQTYKLDFGNFLYGESWISCWK